MRRYVSLIVAFVFAIGMAQAVTVTIVNTFDLGQTPPPGGLGPNAPLVATDIGNPLSALGVTFSASESSPTLYGATINTGTNQLDPPFTDPVLSGITDAVITLNFASATTFLSFDVVYGDVLSNSTVTVSIGGVATPFSTTAGFGMGGIFSEGHVLDQPASPFTQAIITFGPDGSGLPFAIDNLSYDTDPPGVPEPGSLIFLGSGAAALLALGHRKLSSRA
jgi:hypothetical protein